jgi:hypothetical protein
MKTKSLLVIFILFLFSSIAALAQPTIKFEKVVKQDASIQQVLKSDDNGYYIITAIRAWMPSFVIKRYTNNHVEKWSKEVDGDRKTHYTSFESVFAVSNKVVYFYKVTDKKTKMKQLIATEININGSISEPTVVAEMSSKSEREFYIQQSNKNDRFYIFFVDDKQSDKIERVNCVLLNNDLKITNSHEFTMPEPAKGYRVNTSTFTHNNESRIFFHGGYTDLSNPSLPSLILKSQVLGYDFETNQEKIVDIKFNVPSLGCVFLHATIDRLYFLSYCSDKKRELCGLVCGVINQKSFEVVGTQINTFNGKPLDVNGIKKIGVQNDGRTEVDEVLVREDGSVAVLTTEYMTPSNSPTLSYSSSVIFLLSESGKMENSIYVPKQSSRLAQQMYTVDGNIYMVFGDNSKKGNDIRLKYGNTEEAFYKLGGKIDVVNLLTISSESKVSYQYLTEPDTNFSHLIITSKMRDTKSGHEVWVVANDDGNAFKAGTLKLK